jgi:hypothetical protein
MGIYYFESNKADVLTLEGCQITIPGFSNRFESWLIDKECFFKDWKANIDDFEERERIRREEEARRFKEWQQEQDKIAEQKRLEEEKRLAEEEEARLRSEREREEELKCNTEEKKAELARKRAMEHPHLAAVFEILSGCTSVYGRFQFKVTDGYQFRRANLDIQSISMDCSRSRIVLLLTNKTQAFLFINENGEEDQVERSGSLFMNIDMNDVPLKNIKEELDAYFSFR